VLPSGGELARPLIPVPGTAAAPGLAAASVPWAAVGFHWLAELVDAAEPIPGTAAAPCTDPATLPWGAAELAWVAAFPCGTEPDGAAAPFPWIAPPPGAPTAGDVLGVAAGDSAAAGV
jgi:hypothetical protein